MSGKANLSARLTNFKEKFMQLAAGKHSGYDSLDQQNSLEQPLVGGIDSDPFAERPSEQRTEGYKAPTGFVDSSAAYGSTVPNQVMEMQQLTYLSKEAAGILWEMIALGETGAALDDMVDRAQQLQGQLRGLIGDVPEADEHTLAEAFQSFDMLGRCLSEMGKAPPEPVPASTLEPIGQDASKQPAEDTERPLIEL